MAYSTQADVQHAAGGAKRLQQLSDFDQKNAIDAAVVAKAIANADAEINEHLHKRYGVTLSNPVPPGIVAISAELAVHDLKKARRMVSDVDMQLREAALERLQGIAKGMTTLGVSPQPEKSELVVDKAIKPDTDVAVRRESLVGFW